MKLIVLSVYDSKAAAFLQPFFAQSRGVAIRSFAAAAELPADGRADATSHDFCKYPDDFSLFELGSFDQESAKFDLHSAPESLGLASQLRGNN